MRRIAHVVCLAALGLVLGPAEAGHEQAVYPSYYPHEIRVEALDPPSAAKHLLHARIHAYVGSAPIWSGRPPDTMQSVESLGSYLVLTFDSAFVKRTGGDARCRAAAGLAATVRRQRGRLVFHPYPITPYHADYVDHFDLSEAARQRYLSAAVGSAATKIGVRARGSLAEELFGVAGTRKTSDATVEEIPLSALVASHAAALNGWLAPPWIKQGWFHALLLLAPTVADARVKAEIESLAGRLETDEYRSLEDKLNLERDLVTRLQSGCERVVLGYTVKREYFNAEYSAGIENVAYDSQTGLDSWLFIRTAKLKDFPWNGSLSIGVDGAPSAAWNPIGGFTDPAGRLLWRAIGDPALLPAPYDDGWILNRAADVRAEPRR